MKKTIYYIAGAIGLIASVILLGYLLTIYGVQSGQIAYVGSSVWEQTVCRFLNENPTVVFSLAAAVIVCVVLTFALDRKKKVIAKD